jgi:hypothetical protein
VEFRQARQIRQEKARPDLTDTYSEAWMRECELRMICAMPSKERRDAYFALVARHRGQASADRLRQEAKEMWDERQKAKSAGGV